MFYLALITALQSVPVEASRPYGGHLASAQPPAELARCVGAQLDKAGDVHTTPNGDNLVLFFTFKVLPFLSGNGGHMQLTAAPEGAGSKMTATYGHPISAKTVSRQFRIFAKKCNATATPDAAGGKN